MRVVVVPCTGGILPARDSSSLGGVARSAWVVFYLHNVPLHSVGANIVRPLCRAKVHRISPQGELETSDCFLRKQVSELQAKPPLASQRLFCNSLRHLHAFTPFSEKGVKSPKIWCSLLGSLQQDPPHEQKLNANMFPMGITADGVVGRDWFHTVLWWMFAHHHEEALGMQDGCVCVKIRYPLLSISY